MRANEDGKATEKLIASLGAVGFMPTQKDLKMITGRKCCEQAQRNNTPRISALMFSKA